MESIFEIIYFLCRLEEARELWCKPFTPKRAYACLRRPNGAGLRLGAVPDGGDHGVAEAPTEPAGETWRMPPAGGTPSLHPARFLKKAGQKLYVNRNLTHSKAVAADVAAIVLLVKMCYNQN